jgi:carbon-monoxide dehydrogenase medium subunit
MPSDARWGYEKACRKPGDFAHAMAAVLLHGDKRRAVVGALGGKPLLLQGEDATAEGAARALADLDRVQLHMQLAVLRRALEKAAA